MPPASDGAYATHTLSLQTGRPRGRLSSVPSKQRQPVNKNAADAMAAALPGAAVTRGRKSASRDMHSRRRSHAGAVGPFGRGLSHKPWALVLPTPGDKGEASGAPLPASDRPVWVVCLTRRQPHWNATTNNFRCARFVRQSRRKAAAPSSSPLGGVDPNPPLRPPPDSDRTDRGRREGTARERLSGSAPRCALSRSADYGTRDAAACRTTVAASDATQKPLWTSSLASLVTLAR